MDGDIAPLQQIAEICTKRQATLAVDDAHGFGVLGDSGAGTLEQLGLRQSQVPALMATFGKALGGYGAFIAGPGALIEMLVQRARPYIYTTALPPALAVVATTGLRIVREESWRRDRLQQLVQRFRHGAQQLGLSLLPSDTPIQPLVIGAAPRALEASERLLEQGILVTAIRPPTVPENTSRLRITLSAAHQEQHIDRLLEALALAER
jgi:8-amino-7-oxononanoate synthase